MAEKEPLVWLNSEFLKFCLQGEGQVEIKRFSTSRAVPPGNNFSSVISRVKVEYTTRTGQIFVKNLIVKAPFDVQSMSKTYGNFEHRENIFYDAILPEIQKLYSLNLSPRTYPSNIDLVLVFEDLNELGYEMMNRHSQLDLDHCKLLITTFAKFHAVGRVLQEKNPKLVESIGPHMLLLLGEKLKDKDEGWKFFVKSSLKCLADTLEDLKDFKEERDVLKKAVNTTWDLMMKFLDSENSFKSLIHGDIWVNNIMFRSSSGKIDDVNIFDWQLVSFSSIAYDLVQISWLCADNNVRQNHLDDLYQLHCDTFNSTMQNLGGDKVMTKSMLREVLKSASPCALYTACCRLPAHLYDGVFNSDEMVKLKPKLGLDTYKELHGGKYYDSVFPKILKQLGREGVFDYFKKV